MEVRTDIAMTFVRSLVWIADPVDFMTSLSSKNLEMMKIQAKKNKNEVAHPDIGWNRLKKLVRDIKIKKQKQGEKSSSPSCSIAINLIL